MNSRTEDLGNSLELSEPFRYPEDTLPEDLQAAVSQSAERLANDRCIELLNRLCSYALPANNTRLALTAFCYASGMDLSYIFGCDNTETAIAKALGIHKGTFSKAVLLVRNQLNIDHCNTGKDYESKQTYRETNFRAPTVAAET